MIGASANISPPKSGWIDLEGIVSVIKNRTFDELEPGDTASITRTFEQKDIAGFTQLSIDAHPARIDASFANSESFLQIVAHGMWGGALIWAVIGAELPGPGTICLTQSLRFHRPIALGDTLTVTVAVIEKIRENHRVVLDCGATNQRGQTILSGSAEIVAPTTKVCRPLG